MEPVQAHGRSKDKRWHYLTLFGIFLLILFLIGWVPRFFHNRKVDAMAAREVLPQVVLMNMVPNTKPLSLVLPSSAQAWHFTPIWARVNGYLLRYLVDIGDTVKKGDLLAEIDTPETDQQLAQAQADLLNSIVERDIAKVTSERWQKLWNKNPEAVTKQEVDQYNANYKSAQAIVIANEKNVARLTYQQQFKNIYAPFDGVVTNRSVDIGSLIYGTINGVPQELFQMAQTNTIRFYVNVPQNYYRLIKNGIEVEASVQEFPNKVFKGKISRFAKALDPIARTLLTEIDIANPEGLLYPGVYGNVKFLFKPDTMNFIIPTTAIIIHSGLPHVAVVDSNDIVHLRKVQIGLDYGNEMEIVSGLQENEHIVTIPSDRIKEGTKVKVIKNDKYVLSK